MHSLPLTLSHTHFHCALYRERIIIFDPCPITLYFVSLFRKNVDTIHTTKFWLNACSENVTHTHTYKFAVFYYIYILFVCSQKFYRYESINKMAALPLSVIITNNLAKWKYKYVEFWALSESLSHHIVGKQPELKWHFIKVRWLLIVDHNLWWAMLWNVIFVIFK